MYEKYSGQLSLFEYDPDDVSMEMHSPAEKWDLESAKRALDELFSLTGQYKASKSFFELASFITRFKFYSLFNAMLIHTQMPGAKYAATPKRWRDEFRRSIKAGARPIVILQPMGPVMFVFDVADTEPTDENSPPLPQEVEKPFEVKYGKIERELDMITQNAVRDGVRVCFVHEGSQSAGSIRRFDPKNTHITQKFTRKDETTNIPVRYDMVVNENHGKEERFVTIAHELAHLYCGHLGTINPKWWPDRRGLDQGTMEFEAESAAYLVCERIGIKNPSEAYLSNYVDSNEQIPAISLDCVIRAATLIETMSRQNVPLRK
jgi:hypothetical protein